MSVFVFCLCNLCPILYNYLAIDSPRRWILVFNLSLWIRYWLFGPQRGPAERLNQCPLPHPVQPSPNQSSLGDCSSACIYNSTLSIFILTWLLPSRPPLEVGQGQTKTESGWGIEPSCYPLPHKASVLPLTRDGLLCRSLQPMASYTILHLLPLFSPYLPPSSYCGYRREDGGKKDRGSRGRGASGGRGGWRFDTVRQD